MVNKLTKLYNTLMLIETKGENTKIMAQCLQYLEQMVNEEQGKSAEPSTDEPTAETT
jgi:hypothetical protein